MKYGIPHIVSISDWDCDNNWVHSYFESTSLSSQFGSDMSALQIFIAVLNTIWINLNWHSLYVFSNYAVDIQTKSTKYLLY